jgi:phosphoglycolate phosphatase
MNNIEIFIFDFDGTISDTFAHIKEIGEVIAPEFGIDISNIDEKEIEKLKKMSFREIHNYFGVSMLELPKIIKRAKEEFNAISGEIKLIPGMKDVIKTLHHKGKILGILTSNNVENVNKVLHHHRLALFDFIVESPKLGGKNKLLKNILRQMHYDKTRVIYLGDETRDIIAAQKADVISAGVTWGMKKKEELEKDNPDFIFEKPEEILSIV